MHVLSPPPPPQTQKCVQAGCAPEVACGLNIDGGDDLGTGYQLEMEALVEVPVTTPTSSAAGAGDADDEFETAVGLWLGVDPGEVSVRREDHGSKVSNLSYPMVSFRFVSSRIVRREGGREGWGGALNCVGLLPCRVINMRYLRVCT